MSKAIQLTHGKLPETRGIGVMNIPETPYYLAFKQNHLRTAIDEVWLTSTPDYVPVSYKALQPYAQKIAEMLVERFRKEGKFLIRKSEAMRQGETGFKGPDWVEMVMDKLSKVLQFEKWNYGDPIETNPDIFIPTRANLEKLRPSRLRTICDQLKIDYTSNLNKSQLIARILKKAQKENGEVDDIDSGPLLVKDMKVAQLRDFLDDNDIEWTPKMNKEALKDLAEPIELELLKPKE